MTSYPVKIGNHFASLGCQLSSIPGSLFGKFWTELTIWHQHLGEIVAIPPRFCGVNKKRAKNLWNNPTSDECGAFWGSFCLCTSQFFHVLAAFCTYGFGCATAGRLPFLGKFHGRFVLEGNLDWVGGGFNWCVIFGGWNLRLKSSWQFLLMDFHGET